MREFNSKLPKECINRLNEYLADEELKESAIIFEIYGYCVALSDAGIITIGERIEIYDMCMERYFEERYGK